MIRVYGNELRRVPEGELGARYWRYRGDVNGVELDVHRLPPRPPLRHPRRLKGRERLHGSGYYVNVIAIGDTSDRHSGWSTTLEDGTPEEAAIALELALASIAAVIGSLRKRPGEQP